MSAVSAFIANLRAHPGRWDDAEFELQREAMMRHINGDPFARVFWAFARSRDMLRQAEAIGL